MTAEHIASEIKALGAVMTVTGQSTRALAALAADAGFDWDGSLENLERFLRDNHAAKTNGQPTLDDKAIHDAALLLQAGYLAGLRSRQPTA